MMILFGVILLVPALAARFEMATAGVASRADGQMNTLEAGSLRGQFLGGLLLGMVWSPCIGPTLGGAIALASQGENLGYVTLTFVAVGLMLFFQVHHVIEGWLLDIMPIWLQDLSVIL